MSNPNHNPNFHQYDDNFVNSIFNLLNKWMGITELHSISEVGMSWDVDMVGGGYHAPKNQFASALILGAIDSHRLQELATYAIGKRPDFGINPDTNSTDNTALMRRHIDRGINEKNLDRPSSLKDVKRMSDLNTLIPPCLTVLFKNNSDYFSQVINKLENKYPDIYSGISLQSNSTETLVQNCQLRSSWLWSSHLYDAAQEVSPQFKQLYTYTENKYVQDDLAYSNMANELNRLQGLGRSA